MASKSGIEAQVVADSVSEGGARLTTLQLRYPRFIHAEFMTHRVFSRNASSSRAIPVAKMVEQVRNAPAMPIHWGRNQAGMQAHEELVGDDLFLAQARWLHAATLAAHQAEAMAEIGAHKQIVNRILEPFLFISVVVTATEWANFFELRAHPDAQPEIQALALEMRAAMRESTPVVRPFGHHADSWHLPYVSNEERRAALNDPKYLARLSAARCARVSYLNHDGTAPSIQKDLELYDRLVGSRPMHASPIEHQAYPERGVRSRNFSGWRQFREVVEAASSYRS